MRRALTLSVVSAVAYGLLELAFVAQRNQLLPWEKEHVSLLLIFALLHLAVALAATLAAAAIGIGRRFPTMLPFVPVATLVAVHAVSWFRERSYALPRDLNGTLGSLGLAVLPFAVAAALAFALRRRPRAAGGAAWIAAVGLVVWGGVRVQTVEPMGVGRVADPRPADDRLDAVETGQHVFVLGFDGATWAVVDRLIAEGRMPHLQALAARGRTFDLETFRPTFSPVIWTSVSTGKDRFAHGIHDVVQTTLPGGTMLHRSMERTAFLTKTAGTVFRALDRARALRLTAYRSEEVHATSVFEAASEAGLSVSRISWYVTWPARALTGVTVSDRFHLLDPEGPQLTGVVAPEALTEPLTPQVVTARDIDLDTLLEFVDTDGLDEAGKLRWAEENASFLEEMRLVMARDLTTRNVAVDLLSRDRDWRLYGVYLRAVDLTHHLAWEVKRKDGDVDGNPRLRIATCIDRYHEFMDGVVGEILAQVPDDATVILLSDHGFEDRFAHSRGPDGIAVMAGGPVAPSSDRGRISVYDVAPTAAALLGLPVAADLEGRARTDLLDPGFVAEHAVRAISTWERVGARDVDKGGGADRAIEDAEIERLRALGYLR